MKKKDIIGQWNVLQTVGDLKGASFSYAVAKNINQLKPEVEALEKAIEESADFKEFEKKRIALALKYAKKENGKPVIENKGYVLEDPIAFEKEFKELKDEYQKTIDERESQFKDYKEILEEEVLILF